MGFFIGIIISMDPKQRDWIYESPDSGQTVYRRRAGDATFKREQVASPPPRFYEDQMWEYRREWDSLAEQYPAIKEYLDKLLTTVKLIR